MKIIKAPIFLFSFLFLVSCAKSVDLIVDLSSPENATQTFFKAMVYKNPEAVLESLSSESKKKYGENYNQQFSSLTSNFKKTKLNSYGSLRIVGIDYIDESHAKVKFDQLNKKGVFIKNSVAHTIKEDDQWKIDIASQMSLTPEQIEMNKRIKEALSYDYILDEEQNSWVAVSKKSDQ